MHINIDLKHPYNILLNKHMQNHSNSPGAESLTPSFINFSLQQMLILKYARSFMHSLSSYLIPLMMIMMMGILCCCVVYMCLFRNEHRSPAMVVPVLLTDGLVRCEAALHGCGTSLVFFVCYALAT